MSGSTCGSGTALARLVLVAVSTVAVGAAAPLAAAELQVNSYTPGTQGVPAVGMNANGDFVVVWNSLGQDGFFTGVFGQRFASGGTRLGVEFQVPVYTAAQEQNAAVVMRDNGGFAVVWSTEHDGDEQGVFARAFTSAGTAIGGELQINAYTTGGQIRPSLAVDDNGAVVVTWESYGQDGSEFGVFGRRIGPAGALLGAEFQVAARTTGNQQSSRVVREPTGEFVVAWESDGQDGDSLGVFARRFDPTAVAAEGEFQINMVTAGRQSDPALAMDGAGGFVVAWRGQDDGDGYGVFARRVGAVAILDVDADGTIGALTDGLLVLRFMFGFTGTPLVAGAVGPNCTRCDAAPIAAYLQSLV